MARPAKKYFYIYKTTNLLNGKFYIGMHSTNNLDDSYLGSGTHLRRSIRKYGKENFKLEIIEFLPDLQTLKERERNLVNEELLKDPMCMNLVYGGGGGFISPEGYKKGAKRMNEIVWADPIYRQRHSDRVKKMWKDGKGIRCDWTGRCHTEETKSNIGLTNSMKQMGEGNSQFGKHWITNGIENIIIKKEKEIPSGWKVGRTIQKQNKNIENLKT